MNKGAPLGGLAASQWQLFSTDVLQAIRFGRKVRGLWLRPVRNAAWGRSHLFAMTFFDLDQRAYRENGR